MSSVFQRIFAKRSRGEPEKPQVLEINKMNNTTYLFPVTASEISETSFMERSKNISLERPNNISSERSNNISFTENPVSRSSLVPAGLYCVIEDFLTEYDLRLLEEEERADMIARKSKEIK